MPVNIVRIGRCITISSLKVLEVHIFFCSPSWRWRKQIPTLASQTYERSTRMYAPDPESQGGYWGWLPRRDSWAWAMYPKNEGELEEKREACRRPHSVPQSAPVTSLRALFPPRNCQFRAEFEVRRLSHRKHRWILNKMLSCHKPSINQYWITRDLEVTFCQLSFSSRVSQSQHYSHFGGAVFVLRLSQALQDVYQHPWPLLTRCQQLLPSFASTHCWKCSQMLSNLSWWQNHPGWGALLKAACVSPEVVSTLAQFSAMTEKTPALLENVESRTLSPSTISGH